MFGSSPRECCFADHSPDFRMFGDSGDQDVAASEVVFPLEHLLRSLLNGPELLSQNFGGV